MSRDSLLQDQANSFGWISIALHWGSALAITVLWILGRSIEFQAPDLVDTRRSLHISLGLAVWLLLAGRIYWRLKNPHPQAEGQSNKIHTVARAAHYLMLLLLAVMIVSGPIMAWTLSSQPGIAGLLHAIHSYAANLLLVLVVVHVAGALKHLMFDSDETIARIFLPRR